eukprot:scaffold4369_cov336-Prasinococcus_capsulatus_cf.AAC.2
MPFRCRMRSAKAATDSRTARSHSSHTWPDSSRRAATTQTHNGRVLASAAACPAPASAAASSEAATQGCRYGGRRAHQLLGGHTARGQSLLGGAGLAHGSTGEHHSGAALGRQARRDL